MLFIIFGEINVGGSPFFRRNKEVKCETTSIQRTECKQERCVKCVKFSSGCRECRETGLADLSLGPGSE